MVAKSYQSLTILDNPFKSNGKMYVHVRNEKTGTIRTVRYYTQAEYNKMYPEEKTKSAFYKTQKEVLGFSTIGYIYIYVGAVEENIELFKYDPQFRCARTWGWYTHGLPTVDLPAGVSAIKLPWTLVGNENGCLKPEMEIRKNLKGYINNENYIFNYCHRGNCSLCMQSTSD